MCRCNVTSTLYKYTYKITNLVITQRRPITSQSQEPVAFRVEPYPSRALSPAARAEADTNHSTWLYAHNHLNYLVISPEGAY